MTIGASGKPSLWWNGGVRKENVYLATRGKTKPQQVLALRFQGEQTTQGLPALGRTVKLAHSDVAQYIPDGAAEKAILANGKVQCETCSAQPVDATTKGRVGSILTSAQNYGSGLFEAYCRIPNGNAAEVGGLGYVFAMWTFHYTETYPLYWTLGSGTPTAGVNGSGWRTDPAGQQWGGNQHATNPLNMSHMEYSGQGQSRMSCGLYSHNCDKTLNWCPPAFPGGPRVCDKNNGPYTVINHEIDIEIPSNSCQLPKSDLGQRPELSKSGIAGWRTDTINLNSWVSDDQDYSTGSPYRNVGVRRLDNRSYIAKDEEDYHWYGFVWCTGDDTVSPPRKPYIDFYFDRKFIQRITDVHVPSRAGKLNIGPWFGWWGGPKSAYGAKEVLIKYLNIVPFAAVTDTFAAAAAPTTAVDVAALAQHWTGDGSMATPLAAKGPLMDADALPRLTAAQLNKLYLTVAATQCDSHVPATPLNECDVVAANNDLNALQMFDQAGNSPLRNICDFAQFEVVPGLAGQVVAAGEPTKYTNANGWATAAQRSTWANRHNADDAWVYDVFPTLQRSNFYDVDVDPTAVLSPCTDFKQSGFRDATPREATLCCDPNMAWFPGKAVANPCAPPPPPLSSGKKQLAATAEYRARPLSWPWVVLLVVGAVVAVGVLAYWLQRKGARDR